MILFIRKLVFILSIIFIKGECKMEVSMPSKKLSDEIYALRIKLFILKSKKIEIEIKQMQLCLSNSKLQDNQNDQELLKEISNLKSEIAQLKPIVNQIPQLAHEIETLEFKLRKQNAIASSKQLEQQTTKNLPQQKIYTHSTK